MGVVLGVLHLKLKPPLDEKAIGTYAQSMTNSIEWQGQIAPDFEFKTMKGERFQLSDNIGKNIIVVNFFATWCGPCREEMPELNRYFNEHKVDSFLLIGIDAEEKQDRVEQFLKDVPVDFPLGIDEGDIQKKYGVSAFPTTVLIGMDGKVQFYETGELVNAEVAFDNLLRQNRELRASDKAISPEDYRLQAQKHQALPMRQRKQRNQRRNPNSIHAARESSRAWIARAAAIRKSRPARAILRQKSRKPLPAKTLRTNRMTRS